MPLNRKIGQNRGRRMLLPLKTRKHEKRIILCVRKRERRRHLKALSMAENLGSKVDLILKKLNKLDSIELRLENLNKSVAYIEECFAIIEKRWRSLKGEDKEDSQKVNDHEQSVDYNDQDISDLQRDVKGLRHDVDNLKMQLLSVPRSRQQKRELNVYWNSRRGRYTR